MYIDVFVWYKKIRKYFSLIRGH